MKIRFRQLGVSVFVAVTMSFINFCVNADDGFWTLNGNGSWANAANWDSGDIADGTDNTGFFGTFVNITATRTVTLDGARTIGNLLFTDQSGADGWILNPGTGGPLTLDATFDNPSISVAIAPQLVTINAVLAGTNGMEKLGPGTLLLTATNIFSGEIIVSAGTLRVNGSIGGDSVTVAAGMLGGTGILSAPVTMQSGATLAPGNSNNIGILNISNALTLLAGSTTKVDVNASTLTRDLVQGLASVSYGGSLVVSNLAGTLLLGQTFQIFSAATATGNFNTIAQNAGPWLRWKFSPLSGMLSVVSSASKPAIGGATLSGGNILVTATNGAPGATVYLLGSTNVSLPVTNWTRLATNVFDVSGNIAFTNSLSAVAPQRYFRAAAVAAP